MTRIATLIARLSRLQLLSLLLASVAGSSHAQTISASQHRTCASSADGRLYCWGRLENGRTVPVDSGPIPAIPMASGVRVTQVATGWLHDCVLFSSDIVQCSGLNQSGELGRGRNASCRAGEADGSCTFNGEPGPVAGSLRFRSVVAGLQHSCALTKGGVAYCWGRNTAGQTGIGTRSIAVYVPTAVLGQHRFRQLSAGDSFTCGVTSKGSIYCWGVGYLGQVGGNSTLHGCETISDSCTTVPTPLDSPLHDFVQVSAGYLHACALTKAGRAYCWGRGFGEQDSAYRNVIVRVDATFRFISLASGYEFTCGISTDRRAYCWTAPGPGVASIGRELLGWGCSAGTMCLDESPVGDSLRFLSVTAAEKHACGIGTNGRVYCWGAHDVSSVGSAPSRADETHPCRREGFAADPGCGDNVFEIPVPNLLESAGESRDKLQ